MARFRILQSYGICEVEPALSSSSLSKLRSGMKRYEADATMFRVRNPSCYAYPASTGHPSATTRGEKIVPVSCLFLYKFLSLSHTHTHWVDNPQKCDLWKHQALQRIERCFQHGARGWVSVYRTKCNVCVKSVTAI